MINIPNKITSIKPKYIKPTTFKLKQITQSISLALIATTTVQSAEFIVTTDGDTGGGAANEISTGVFEVNTLRSAIELADNENAFPGADTISFADNLFINNQADIHLDAIGDSFTFGNHISNSALGINSEIIIVGPEDATLNLIAGDLRHFQINDDGHLNISHVTLGDGVVPSDSTFGRGGAIYVRTGGSLNLSNSTLSNNQAGSGGAVFIGRSVSVLPSVIIDSQFTGNQASFGGGAVSLDSDLALTVSNSTFTHNSARDGGAIFTSGNLIIKSSAIYNNTARSGGGVDTNNNGTLTLINSTVFNNQTQLNGGGIGIGTEPGEGINTIINSTITANQSRNDTPPQQKFRTVNRGTGIDFDTTGGGVFVSNADNLILHNSIITGNTETTAMLADDMAAFPLSESSHNLIGAGDSVFAITDGINGNQIGTRAVPIDAQLLPLADNGGPTLTQIPQSSSPAIDTGNDLLCEQIDQRGFIRPADGDGNGSAICDIGAVEVGGIPDLIFSDGFDR